MERLSFIPNLEDIEEEPESDQKEAYSWTTRKSIKADKDQVFRGINKISKAKVSIRKLDNDEYQNLNLELLVND
jgi:hypothetical protein